MSNLSVWCPGIAAVAGTAVFSLSVLFGGCAPPEMVSSGTGGSSTTGHETGGAGTATGGRSASGGETASGSGGDAVSSGGAPAGSGGVSAGSGGADTGTGGAGVGGAPAGGMPGGGRSGGSGGTAGMVGAGGQAPSANCPSTAVFCDDFEDGNLDGWVKMESGGALAIDSTHALSGKNALGITMATGQRGGWLQRMGAPLFPLPNNTIYGRVMMYFESLPAGHTDFVRASATNGQTPWYNVGEQTGKVLLNYYASGSDCWARPSPSTNIPLNKWMCWEWVYDGPKNQMGFYIDSQLSRMVNGSGDGCSGSNVWTAPKFNYLAVGAYNAQPGNAPSVGKMWFDDVAVSTTARVGCPAK
ncbi:MAG: hypothetical protein ABI560_05615 [Myxococcales bacterium]